MNDINEKIEEALNMSDHPPGWWRKPFYVVPIENEGALFYLWRQYFCRTRWEQKNMPRLIRWRAKLARILIVIFYE